MKLLPHPKMPTTYKGLSSDSWINTDINDSMISSHRNNYLDRLTFPASLHFHDYYEVVVILDGDIRYVCENVTIKPKNYDVIVIPPGKFHMSMIAADETQYIRHVFYFYPDAFSAYQCNELLNFTQKITSDSFSFSLSRANQEKLLNLFSDLESNVRKHTPENHALILADVLQIFYLFNQPVEMKHITDNFFSDSFIDIQSYIDNHFVEIDTIEDIAAKTFYTREHISRLFKKYKNITVTEYILKRRINYSCQLMKTEMTLAQICFQAGFGSVPAFIRAFKSVMGMTPSRYRKNLNANSEFIAGNKIEFP